MYLCGKVHISSLQYVHTLAIKCISLLQCLVMVPGVLLFICILLFAAADADNQIPCHADCTCTGTDYAIDLSKIEFPSRVKDPVNIKFSYSITPCSPVKCSAILSVVSTCTCVILYAIGLEYTQWLTSRYQY